MSDVLDIVSWLKIYPMPLMLSFKGIARPVAPSGPDVSLPQQQAQQPMGLPEVSTDRPEDPASQVIQPSSSASSPTLDLQPQANTTEPVPNTTYTAIIVIVVLLILGIAAFVILFFRRARTLKYKENQKDIIVQRALISDVPSETTNTKKSSFLSESNQRHMPYAAQHDHHVQYHQQTALTKIDQAEPLSAISDSDILGNAMNSSANQPRQHPILDGNRGSTDAFNALTVSNTFKESLSRHPTINSAISDPSGTDQVLVEGHDFTGVGKEPVGGNIFGSGNDGKG